MVDLKHIFCIVVELHPKWLPCLVFTDLMQLLAYVLPHDGRQAVFFCPSFLGFPTQLNNSNNLYPTVILNHSIAIKLIKLCQEGDSRHLMVGQIVQLNILLSLVGRCATLTDPVLGFQKLLLLSCPSKLDWVGPVENRPSTT